jgi:starch synthase
MNLLFISDEISPLSGDSALGRAVAHLGGALCALGHTVTAVAPLRSPEAVVRYSLARRLSPVKVAFPDGEEPVLVFDGRLPSGVAVRLIQHDRLFLEASPDEAPRREVLLARAALALAEHDVAGGHAWHVVHGFSTAGALATRLTRAFPSLAQVKTVYCVGDLAERPRCDKSWVERLGLPWSDFTPDGFEFYGELDLVKAGLTAADRLLFCGPAAALDAFSEATGHGLDGLFRARRSAVASLAPGLDYSRWNPTVDALLPVRFDAAKRDGKLSCKTSLQHAVGLPVAPDAPLLAILPPAHDLSPVLTEAVDRILRADVQVIAVRGLDPALEAAFDALVAQWPRQVARTDGRDATVHALLGGADLAVIDAPAHCNAELLLAASRYGAIPIVRATGVARDLVVDLTASLESGNGFVLAGEVVDAHEAIAVLERACAAVRRRDRLGALLARTMTTNVSWERRAQTLEQVYADALK